jgi:hypothetical protein
VSATRGRAAQLHAAAQPTPQPTRGQPNAPGRAPQPCAYAPLRARPRGGRRRRHCLARARASGAPLFIFLEPPRTISSARRAVFFARRAVFNRPTPSFLARVAAISPRSTVGASPRLALCVPVAGVPRPLAGEPRRRGELASFLSPPLFSRRTASSPWPTLGLLLAADERWLPSFLPARSTASPHGRASPSRRSSARPAKDSPACGSATPLRPARSPVPLRATGFPAVANRSTQQAGVPACRPRAALPCSFAQPRRRSSSVPSLASLVPARRGRVAARLARPAALTFSAVAAVRRRTSPLRVAAALLRARRCPARPSRSSTFVVPRF